MTKTKGFVAHREALDWLISTPHMHLVGENCLEHARALCRIIDKEATCSHPIWIILEVHHKSEQISDISFYVRRDLLNVSSDDQPLFGSLSSLCVGPTGRQESMENIWVEFDHTDSGYKPMGFFEPSANLDNSEQVLLEWISTYTRCRQQDLAVKLEDSSIFKGIELIKVLIKLLGFPAQVGFLSRGACSIKLVLMFSEDMVAPLSRLCRQLFSSEILGEFWEEEALEELLCSLAVSDKNPRISVDIDLANGCVHDRLCLEEGTALHISKKEHIDPRAPQQHISFGFNARDCFKNILASKKLEEVLPYAARRPSNNLIEDEIICIRHGHRKFVLAKNKKEIKDYVYIAYDRTKANLA